MFQSKQQSVSDAWVKASADVQSLSHVFAQQRAAVRERNFREALELLRAVDALSLAEAAAHQRAHQLRAGQALEARKNPPLHNSVSALMYERQAVRNWSTTFSYIASAGPTSDTWSQRACRNLQRWLFRNIAAVDSL